MLLQLLTSFSFCEIILLLILCVVIYELWWYLNQRCDIPGPNGIPLLGYLPFLGRSPHLVYSQLTYKYGSIFQIRLGVKNAIVINELGLLKEALSLTEFADRPSSRAFDMMEGTLGQTSVLAFVPYSPVIEYCRNASTKAIGLMINSKDSNLEVLTDRAIDYAIQKLEDRTEPAAIVTRNATGMIIGSLSFGNIYDADNEDLKQIFETSMNFAPFIMLSGFADFIPPLKLFLPFKEKTFARLLCLVRKYIGAKIDEHTWKDGGEIKDIQDGIEEVFKNTKESTINDLNLNLKTVKHMGEALFGAGFITMSEHYLMALKILAHRNDIQDRVYSEVCKVGADQRRSRITIGDRDSMPYTRAFQLELLRHFSHVVNSLPHATTVDVKLRGFNIPAKTMIISNLYHIHRNRDIFGEDVDDFNPERFMDPKTFDLRKENVVAFGVGKRKCVGELLAQRELFLLIANTVRKVWLELDTFEGETPYDTTFQFTLQCKDATFKLVKRISDD